MRVAVLSYPMLFQSNGGLKMKVGRTVDALNRLGVEARLVDPVRERLTDYDLVHVFACHQGTFRIVQQAKGDRLPVVMSTILNPPFSKWDGIKARVLGRLVGKVSGWKISTSFDQIMSGLELADRLIVLGSIERQMLIDGYGLALDKISIVPNGVGEEFFDATPELFHATYSIPHPFVLHTGLIGDVKNQLGLIRALQNDPIHVVLIGQSNQSNEGYLRECLRTAQGRVHYLGELPHGELLASAYAAADLVAIPSRHEGMPNSILEALAAGKPTVMTNNHTMDISLPPDCVIQVNSYDTEGIRNGVLGLLRDIPSVARCQSVVEKLTWGSVAKQLHGIYEHIA